MTKSPTSHRNIVLIVLSLLFGMAGLTAASVPLYRLFCQVTGYGGTTQAATQAPDRILDREITVRFDANTNPSLPWDFQPEQREMRVKVGQSGLAFYQATNTGDAPVVGTATYNVTPNKAGAFFNKVACFCFEEQLLNPGESMQFPVSFFVDPMMVEEENLDDVDTITLSYTFFPLKN